MRVLAPLPKDHMETFFVTLRDDIEPYDGLEKGRAYKVYNMKDAAALLFVNGNFNFHMLWNFRPLCINAEISVNP